MVKIWVPCDEPPKVMKQVDTRPVWGCSGEQPFLEMDLDEGCLRWFGTGTAVADLRGLPITVKMPFIVVRQKMIWAVSQHVRREMVMALKKITAAAGGAVQTGPGVQDRQDWPVLLEYLTSSQYPDGTPREPSCLILVADAAGWRGCLSDKDNARTMWKSGPTVLDVLSALEQAAAEDDPGSWRLSAAARGKGKKRG